MPASTRTAVQRGAWARNKGAQAERALVVYLRHAGWPEAERAVRTGYRTSQREAPDPGDITNTPGIIWSVKDWAVDQHTAWLEELDRMEAPPGSTNVIRLLVHKRKGYAAADRWWCWLRLGTLARFLPGAVTGDQRSAVRMELHDVVALLRGEGVS